MIWDSLLLISIAWYVTLDVSSQLTSQEYRVCLRLYQLSKISREDLEERLGYDIPPIPEISVAGIKARSVALYWLNSTLNGFAAVTLSIVVNGVKRKLQYPEAGKSSDTLPDADTQTGLEEDSQHQGATIRTSSSLFSKQSSHSSSKDVHAVQQVTTKTASMRRAVSPIRPNTSPNVESSDGSDSGENDSPEYIVQLTTRLESLRALKTEVDKQVGDEEAEAKEHHAGLSKERDELKHELKEKEDSSAELRRQGNHLDKLNRGAQSRRSGKERVLQQKRAERLKVKADITRWDLENAGMEKEIQEIESELDSLGNIRVREMAELRQAIMADQASMKALEEELRVRGAHMKELEQKRDQLETDEANKPERVKSERAKNDAWDLKYHTLQAQLQSMWQALQQSKAEEQKAEATFNWWFTRQSHDPDSFATLPPMESLSPHARNRSHRNRHTNSRTSGQATHAYSGGQGDFNGAPPPYSKTNSTPMQMDSGFNMASDFDQSGPVPADNGNMTGEAMISPAANDLLPSYLFGDEDSTSGPASGIVASSEIDHPDPGHLMRHTVSNSDTSGPCPITPISGDSRANSVFTSPHDSMQNVSSFVPDIDKHSANSTRTPLPSSLTADPTSQPSNRFANLFSSPFGRPRGKSSAQEPPALGTLKQGQSHSYPRDLDQDAYDISGARRRRGSHGTWANPVAGLLNRNSSNAESNVIRARTGSGRSSRLNMFKPRINPLDPSSVNEQETSSSRPSSTYSYEQHFRRPSSESQSIWGPFGDNLSDRNSPLNAKWAVNPSPWSHGPSRSASLQRGSSTNLSMGTTPLDAEDINRPLSRHRPEQAPIGTRPTSQRVPAPKLNPAAPTFKTLFSRSDARKAARIEKGVHKTSDMTKAKEGEKGDADLNEPIPDVSPPHSRLSRDAQSVSTAASTADSRESFERTASGAGMENPVPKESLMQKITRKSSSSKFNVPWSKERGFFSKRAGEPPTPGEIDEDNSSEGQLGKSADSVVSAPHTPREERSGRAWPSIRRKSRKGFEALEKGNEAGEGDD
ncbi:uncharacterized protein KY384_001552 [Bacidia gigantensis]|uniref:uncharacterized protein n=1 Tax=Bacidia gigantensis TaxID=2732470 RepID=UPI001D05B620|nr:uncharacterized protein KY384_001552 [Bacidia gigantensis]KAG8533811.1 hypothetical protein KY384_001552 [Bacidia gigantensis]